MAGGIKDKIRKMPVHSSLCEAFIDDVCACGTLRHLSRLLISSLRSQDERGALCAALAVMDDITRLEAEARNKELEAEGRKLQVGVAVSPKFMMWRMCVQLFLFATFSLTSFPLTLFFAKPRQNSGIKWRFRASGRGWRRQRVFPGTSMDFVPSAGRSSHGESRLRSVSHQALH